MPAARGAAPQLVRLEFLERTRRDLLVRLLSLQPLFFEAHGFSLSALAATAQDDCSLLPALFELLNCGSPDLPPAFAATLLALDAVATDAGHERLRILDAARALPQSRMGNESLAVLACLDHPELFARAKASVAKPATVNAYTEYFARRRAPFPSEPARLAALAKAAGELFAARGRPEFCEPIVTRFSHKTMVDLVIARLPGTHERVREDNRRAQFTDVLTQRLRFFVHHATGTLGVQGRVFEREGIRRIVGQSMFDDPDHFQSLAVYSLARFAEDLDAALSVEGYAPITGIELREIWIRRVDGGDTMERNTVDLRETSANAPIRRALADGGAVEHVKLMASLARGGRAVRVELEPPGKLDMARSDEDVVDLVRGWLAFKGHMLLPEAVMPAADGDAMRGEP